MSRRRKKKLAQQSAARIRFINNVMKMVEFTMALSNIMHMMEAGFGVAAARRAFAPLLELREGEMILYPKTAPPRSPAPGAPPESSTR